jgi:hypothetical protein
MYEKIKVRFEGITPLIMHNIQLANPLNPIAKAMKEISKKKKKTDTDYEALAKLEFQGGLYLDNALEPCLPGYVIEGALNAAARTQRQGKDAQRGILCDGNFALEYDGPREADALWEDERFRFVQAVRVQSARVMRTRPVFPNWAAIIDIQFRPDVLNKTDILKIVDIAGSDIGLLDWRPKYGRFTAEVIGSKGSR